MASTDRVSPIRNTLLVVLLAAASLTAGRLQGQELPLKRTIPGEEAFQCPDVAPPDAPGREEEDQAARLGSSAAQAVILGERERARDLLARAVELDPSSPALAYQYARILEGVGERDAAVAGYCRTLALGLEGADAVDARSRLEQLTTVGRPEIPADAVGAFRSALSATDAGRLEAAAEAFGRAVAAAPDWADAAYDRAVILARMGRREAAVQEFRRYLELRPDAPDAILVSERIGQLQNAGALPSAGTALTLGILLPGMGQFYEGRPLAGLAVLSLVGGAAAAALLIEEVEVKCYFPELDGECLPGNVQSETVNRPYLAAGLGAAAAIGLIGAIEAFMNARGQRERAEGLASFEVGGARIHGPAVAHRWGRVDVRLVRLTF